MRASYNFLAIMIILMLMVIFGVLIWAGYWRFVVGIVLFGVVRYAILCRK